MRLPHISTSALIVIVVAVLVVLAVVEVGLNAGRVHRGVSISGFDVGGLTRAEARAALTRRGRKLATTPIVFTTEGLTRFVIPERIGWEPRPGQIARAAYDVGRSGDPLTSLGERLKAWFGGVDLRWPDEPDRQAVARLIGEWDRELEALGVTLGEEELRGRIAEAIDDLPRRLVPIPVAPS